MCGRYAASKDASALVEEFQVDDEVIDTPLVADYNVAPTKSVYVVLQRRPPGGDGGSDESDQTTRQLRIARWGLVPSWAKDPSIGSRMINARVETVAQKPAFRRAYAARRCLLPADGYFEWYTPEVVPKGQSPTKSGKPRKQPFFITPGDGSSLAMAGLYEWWRDPTKEREAEDAWLLSTVIITTEAADEVGHIHDRMPLVVPPENWSTWLDPNIKDHGVVAPLLSPAMAHHLQAYPVSTAVNDVRHNGPELVLPLPLDQSTETAATSL